MRAGLGAGNRTAADDANPASCRGGLTSPGHDAVGAHDSGSRGAGARGCVQPGHTCGATASGPDQPAGNRRTDACCANPNAYGSRPADTHGRRRGRSNAAGNGISAADTDG